MTPDLLNKELSGFGREEVILSLPKFKTTASSNSPRPWRQWA